MILTFSGLWLLFGAPCLLATAGLSYLLTTFQICRFSIFRRLSFLSAAISIPLIGLLFGISAGYFNAWVGHRNDNGLESRWDLLDISGAPGNILANEIWGDWQSDEVWYYRDKIAIWNGLFWTSTGIAAVPIVCFFMRRHSMCRAPYAEPARLSQ